MFRKIVLVCIDSVILSSAGLACLQVGGNTAYASKVVGAVRAS